MRFVAASFFALAIVAGQAAHSGALIPALAYPAYLLVVVGGMAALPGAVGVLRDRWSGLSVVMLVFGAYLIWRCTVAPDQAFAMTDATMILACVAVWAGMSLALTRNDARFVFIGILLAAGCGQVAVAVIQMVESGHFSMPYWLSLDLQNIYSVRFPYRPRGLFLNPNQFAWLMNILALMALSLGVWGRVRIVGRIALLYLAAVFGAMTIFSASRGGTMSLLVGFAAFLALSLRAVFAAHGTRRILFLCLGGVMLALCVGAAYAAFSTSWVAQGRIDSLLRADVRSAFAEEAIRLFQTRPLLGVGPGIYQYAARLYRTGDVTNDPIFAHDDWLQGLAEYGFVGFGLAVLVLVLAMIAGSKGFTGLVRVAAAETGSPTSSSAAFVLGAVCGLAACAVHSNVDFNLHIPANALLAAALFGIITGTKSVAGMKIAPARLTGWFTAFAALAATAGVAAILVQRGQAEYRDLEAKNAFADGNVKRALMEAEQGLRTAPDDPALRALRGRALFLYDSWLGFQTAASEGATAAPGDTLSDAEREKVNRDSVAEFTRATILQPRERTHHVELARSLVEIKEIDLAREEYLKAITLDPMQAYSWGAYADFLLERGNVPTARRIYEIAAMLPGGAYARSQAVDLDNDAAEAKQREWR